MAHIVLVLHAAPAACSTTQNRSLLALNYAQAAINAGHRIDMVFFYSEAVQHATHSEVASTLWRDFSKQHKIPLVICNTIAELDYQLEPDDIVQPFQSGGLTEFAMASANADHVIQF